MTDSPWMTVPVAAQYTSVSEWIIRKAVHDGELPARAVGKGRNYRLKRDEVDQWMDDNVFVPPSERRP